MGLVACQWGEISDYRLVMQERRLGGPTADQKMFEIGKRPQTNKQTNQSIHI